MYHNKRDASGKFAKKATQGREDNGRFTGNGNGNTETKTQEGVTVVYINTLAGVGAEVDKALKTQGITGIGDIVNKALAGLNIPGLQ